MPSTSATRPDPGEINGLGDAGRRGRLSRLRFSESTGRRTEPPGPAIHSRSPVAPPVPALCGVPVARDVRLGSEQAR